MRMDASSQGGARHSAPSTGRKNLQCRGTDEEDLEGGDVCILCK